MAILKKKSSVIYKYFLKNVMHRFLNPFLKISRSPSTHFCPVCSLHQKNNIDLIVLNKNSVNRITYVPQCTCNVDKDH